MFDPSWYFFHEIACRKSVVIITQPRKSCCWDALCLWSPRSASFSVGLFSILYGRDYHNRKHRARRMARKSCIWGLCFWRRPSSWKCLLLMQISHAIKNLIIQEFKSTHSKVGIQIEHVGENAEDIFVFFIELLGELFTYTSQIFVFCCRVITDLKFVTISQSLLTAQKAEILVRLRPQLLDDHI